MKYFCALNGSSPGAALMRRDVPSGKNIQLCSLSFEIGDHDLIQDLLGARWH